MPTPLNRYILIVAACLALCSLGWGSYRAVTSSNDLQTRYKEWSRMVQHPERLNGWQAPYHPLAYLVFTPFFLCGFTAAKWGYLALNLMCLWYVWRRLCFLVALAPTERWLFLALLGTWACVRVTLSSGQVGLLCLAAVLWAWPLQAWGDGAKLALGLIKYTLVFPLYLRVFLTRPRRLLVPLLVAVVPLGIICFLSGSDALAFVHGSQQAATGMLTWQGGADLGSFLKPFGLPAWLTQTLVWGLWLGTLVWLWRRLRDPLVWLAVLWLMSLWPVYHRPYDLVVAAPALALFLKHLSPGWSGLLSLAMVGVYERLDSLAFFHQPALRQAFGLYYPLIIAVMIAGLVSVDGKRAHGQHP